MNNWKISLQFNTRTTDLPQSYHEFIQIIKQHFQITDFIAKHQGQVINEEYYYTLKDSQERRIQIQQVNKFYDTFISGKHIPCCTDLDCPLCFGSNCAQLRESDQNIIDIIIRNKLQQKMQIIQRKLNIQNVSQFLEFCQPQYSVKWINQQNQVTVGEPNQIVSFKVGYQNNGNIDWPNPVYLVCVEDLRFSNTKYEVKSLKLGEQTETVISFQIPNIEPGQYNTFWRIAQNMKQFGPIIQFKFTCLGRKQEMNDYDKQNRQIFNDFIQKNEDLLTYLDLNRVEDMFRRYRNKIITYDEIYESLAN